MEAPGVSWVILGMAAALLGAGLALLNTPKEECVDGEPFCAGPALHASTAAMLAWGALGMAVLLDILWLGVTHGGTLLGAVHRTPVFRHHR